MLSVVILTSEASQQGRARDMREIVNIASSLAKTKEKVKHDIPILDILFSAKLGVYVAIYEAQSYNVRMKSCVVREGV